MALSIPQVSYSTEPYDGYSPYAAVAPDIMQTLSAQPTGALSSLNAKSGKVRNRPSINPNLDLAVNGDQQGYNFVTNKGKAAGVHGNKSGFVAVDPTAEYRLVNLRGGERDNPIVTSGVGEAGLRDVYANSQLLSARDGKKAYWAVEQLDPTTGDWTRMADDPKGGMRGALTKWGDIVLPTVGAVLGGPLGAALGSAASGTLQGKSIGNIVKNAALSGATAYAGAQIVPGGSDGLIGGLFENQIRSGLGALPTATGGAASSAASGIAKEGIGGLTKAGLGSAVKNAAGSAVSDAVGGNVINVIGSRAAGVLADATANSLASGAGAAIGGIGSSIANGSNTANNSPQNSRDTIYVNHTPVTPVIPQIAGAPLAALPAALPTNFGGTTAPSTDPAKPTDPTKPADAQSSTLDQISSWLQTLGILSPVLGGLYDLTKGGGNGNGNGTIANAGQLGSLNPIFNQTQLPASNLSGLPAGQARAPRTMPQQDWNTYAMRPEQSFFTDVPQRFAEGGHVSHGRSDDVPALLSRGEYVIDAETMALLGNGDPDAGADQMDQWRVNVRKHKGRALSKGDISPNAKMPEQYAGGGRK